MTQASHPPPIRDRFRIRFAKTGLLRWIGHRDLQRLWERLLRRAALPLVMTEGFHPKPRISFPSALALGIEGLDEVLEIELADPVEPAQLRQRLIDDQQPGLSIGQVRLVARAAADGTPDPSFANLGKAKLYCSHYQVLLPEAWAADPAQLQPIDQRIEQLLAQGSLTLARKNKPVTVATDGLLTDLMRRDAVLQMTLVDAAGATPKPSDVLEALALGDVVQLGGLIRRTRVVLLDELQPTNPQEHAQ